MKCVTVTCLLGTDFISCAIWLCQFVLSTPLGQMKPTVSETDDCCKELYPVVVVYVEVGVPKVFHGFPKPR